MNYTLYKHTTPSNKVYIGITSMKVKKRWCGGRGYRHNPHFYKAILKYGWGNIKHEILLTGLTKEKAEWWEKRLIKKYNSTDQRYGYNLEGGGNLQKEISENTREKISLALKGKNLGRRNGMWSRTGELNPNFGRKLSKETKERLSKLHSGTGNPVWGRKHTPEEKNLIGKSLRERRDYCGIRCIETLQVYSTIHEASIATGVSTSTIGRDCCGEKHIGKRLHFERYYGGVDNGRLG